MQRMAAAARQQTGGIPCRHQQPTGGQHLCQRQHSLHRRRQWHSSAAAGEPEPDITDEEAAEMAAAFKKMMEDGIGDELPEMPEASEVWCDCCM
jgi:hypothetical protein